MTKWIFFTLIFCPFFLHSQINNFSIIGKVVDVESKSIEYGNVIILSTKDSSIIKGEFFISGQFIINRISDQDFILKVTAIGFLDQFQLVSRQNNDTILNIGTIQLNPNFTFKEVEIISKLPLFERDGEKVKVNVENSALSSAGTVLDVLKKSPTVMVDNRDNVSIFGKGLAVIYIDGLQIASSDILKTISSTELKAIEIIAEPSAKYDASGKAVIKIITKKNNLEGYNGNLIQNVEYGKYIFSYTGIQFNYKRKKWSTLFSYGFPKGKGWHSDDYYRHVKNNDSTSTEMKNKIFSTSNRISTQYYRAGANYKIDSLSTLGIQYNGFYSQNRNTAENTNVVFRNFAPELTIETYTDSKPRIVNNSANINYTKNLDTLESEFTLTAQYGNFISNNLDDISQQIFIGYDSDKQIKRNNGQNNIQIFTTQADFNKGFNKKLKLESGIKNSYVSNRSEINLDNYSSSGQWISDPSYFNFFKYNENILAGYSQLRYSKNKINMRAGIRTEYTQSDGLSKLNKEHLINRQYLNGFPSAYLGYDFTKDLNAGITFSSRITRPTFQDMDPFINYIDSLSSFRGNPYLLPSYTHSFEASLIYLKQASLTFNYQRTNGAMNLVVEKLNDGTDAFIATTKNLNYSETYSAGITIPYELSWWTTYNYFGYMTNSFSYKSDDEVVQNKKPMFYMYLYDEFRVKKLFSMEVTFEYTSAGADGIFTFKPFYNLSTNIKKTFLNDKLTFIFIANDILSTAFNKGSSKVKGYDINYISKQNTHYFALSLNYHFGKLKANDYKDKTVNKEEYDRIKMKK